MEIDAEVPLLPPVAEGLSMSMGGRREQANSLEMRWNETGGELDVSVYFQQNCFAHQLS